MLRRRDWRQRNRRTAAPPPQAMLLAATTTLATLLGACGHRTERKRRKRRATTERTAPPPPPRIRSRTRFRRWRSFWPLRCQRMNTRHEYAYTGRSCGVSRVLDFAGRLLQQGDDQVLDCAGQGPVVVVVATAFLLALKFASKGLEIRTHVSVVSNSCIIVACLRDLPQLLGLRQDRSGLAPAAAAGLCLCPECRPE